MGLVYYIQRGTHGPIKIGWTSNKDSLKRRLKSLQSGSAERLVLRGTTPAPRAFEGHLHWHFHAARLEGEWFEPIPQVALLARVAGTKSDELDDFSTAAYWALADEIVARSKAPGGPFYKGKLNARGEDAA